MSSCVRLLLVLSKTLLANSGSKLIVRCASSLAKVVLSIIKNSVLSREITVAVL